MNERARETLPRDDQLNRDDVRTEEVRDHDGDSPRMSTADLAYGRSETSPGRIPQTVNSDDGQVTLIQEEDAGGFRERWTSIQTKFIDAPRETVGDADELVAEVIQSLAKRFAEERGNLEQQWQSGTEVSTEDLRLAMQHYRSFFERLLAA